MDLEQKIFKALSSSIRVRILRFLCTGPNYVTLTNKEIKISQPNLSQHLKILKESGLVGSKKIMTKRCYFINKPKKVKQLFHLIDELKLEN